ncbi:hypothetical protein AB1Y20_019234 [Prymnesium parvum]|uniref:Uncharacterized protein n=1 Tax=Prymnesium parvum TaxID=97485 RepID=A0AB34JUF3_PRYPA
MPRVLLATDADGNDMVFTVHSPTRTSDEIAPVGGSEAGQEQTDGLSAEAEKVPDVAVTPSVVTGGADGERGEHRGLLGADVRRDGPLTALVDVEPELPAAERGTSVPASARGDAVAQDVVDSDFVVVTAVRPGSAAVQVPGVLNDDPSRSRRIVR